MMVHFKLMMVKCSLMMVKPSLRSCTDCSNITTITCNIFAKKIFIEKYRTYQYSLPKSFVVQKKDSPYFSLMVHNRYIFLLNLQINYFIKIENSNRQRRHYKTQGTFIRFVIHFLVSYSVFFKKRLVKQGYVRTYIYIYELLSD